MKKKFLKNDSKNQKDPNLNNLNPLALKKQYYSKYINNPDFKIYQPEEKLMALYNRYNFLGILTSGFRSTGSNFIEIIFPEDFDISIAQENGFSIFFWIALQKQPNNVMRYILRRGAAYDQVTPTIGLLPNNSNLFLKVSTSNQKLETLYSNKKLETGKIYSVTATYSFNIEESTSEISLYIDGVLDSQVTLPGIPVHNNGNIYIGKPDTASHGFVGCLSEVMLLPYVLGEEEIKDVNEQSWKCFYMTEGEVFNTPVIFEEKIQRKVLCEKYIKHTGTQPYVLENMNLSNEELREMVKEFDEEERKNDEINKNILGYSEGNLSRIESTTMIKMKDNLEKLLDSPKDYSRIVKFYLNSKIINSILYLANCGDDIIEIRRIVNIFDVLSDSLNFSIDYNFMNELCSGLNCFAQNSKNSISLDTFFSSLAYVRDQYFPEEEMFQVKKKLNKCNSNENLEVLFAGNLNKFNEVFDDSLSLKQTFIGDFNIKKLYNTEKAKHSKQNSAELIKANNNEPLNQKGVTPSVAMNESVKDQKNTKENDVFMTGTLVKGTKENTGETSKSPDNTVIEKKSLLEKTNKTIGEKERKNEWDPEFPKNWNLGAFELCINYCCGCEKHMKTTRHKEYTFKDKFDELSNAVKIMFPNCRIYGNYDDLEYFGVFDVYIHGIGPCFDRKGRYFLFRKKIKQRFPKFIEIVDKLVALSMIYNGSINMEKAQSQFLAQNKGFDLRKSKMAQLFSIE